MASFEPIYGKNKKLVASILTTCQDRAEKITVGFDWVGHRFYLDTVKATNPMQNQTAWIFPETKTEFTALAIIAFAEREMKGSIYSRFSHLKTDQRPHQKMLEYALSLAEVVTEVGEKQRTKDNGLPA